MAFRTVGQLTIGIFVQKHLRILNLYAGIGGNRKLWGDEHEITAVEYKPEIAKIYRDFFPNDKVVVADAHQYLLEHFSEFDFIWSSPPCPTHSRTRTMQKKKVYPDMRLYQEIIFLKYWYKGKYLVENVIPYYKPLISPTRILHRHCIWSNFWVQDMATEPLQTCKAVKERELLQEKFGFNLDDYTGIDKRLLLRNCVVPELGKHILDWAEKDVIIEQPNFILP
ncbi:MAG: C-5 cytosine-specific DNA methylase [Smithella sp. PtaU1.Bin162]|nr:MAG: C-5 cytosine-specific DNA methylase [Smithella sp. PtaU1.Bin162]